MEIVNLSYLNFVLEQWPDQYTREQSSLKKKKKSVPIVSPKPNETAPWNQKHYFKGKIR